MQFSMILYRLRISKGLNLTELARLTGVSLTSLSAYERSYYLPTVENLCKLADFFGVSLDMLMGRDSTFTLPQ